MQQTLRGEGDREIYIRRGGSGNAKGDKWTGNWRGKRWKEKGKDGKRRIHYGQGKKRGRNICWREEKGSQGEKREEKMEDIRRYWRKRMGYYWGNAEDDRLKEQKARHCTGTVGVCGHYCEMRMRGPVKRKLFYKGRDREKEILRILQQTFSLRVRRKEKCISEVK
jgi:hypothetical protein